MNAVEKLKVLLVEKTTELAAREEQLRRLNISTQSLKGQIEGIQEAVNAIGFGDEEQNGEEEKEGKLTPAVLGLIESQGTAPGLLPSEIVNHLLAHGFGGRDRRQFYGSVYPVCQRLARQGKVKEGSKQGKRSFMRIQPV
jgi:hypothetical protein